MKIILVISFSITCIATVTAQNSDNLRALWELTSVERLEPVTFGAGDEIKRIDLRHPTNVTFGDGVNYDSITYKVVGEEIQLFGKDNDSLTTKVGFKIETLTKDELSLLIVPRSGQKAIIRLRYRAVL
jgi:hypothetical protein